METDTYRPVTQDRISITRLPVMVYSHRAQLGPIQEQGLGPEQWS